MRTIATLSCFGLLSLATAANAADPEIRAYAATTLQQAQTSAVPYKAPVAGASSAIAGDKWTAANLFERAVRDHNTPLNRFNLAAAYQQTGRLDLAAALYRTVAADGEFTIATLAPPMNDRNARAVNVNIADESRRRLALMGPLLPRNSVAATLDQETVTAAPADARANVETLTAAPADAPQAAALGRVSDGTAMARDAAIQP